MLRLENVETLYDRVYVLRGVSLQVEEGTITAVLGPNGAGKTTLLKTVMGLLDDQPDKGRIWFCGTRIDGRDTEAVVRMGIGYVPEGRDVFEDLSVIDNLRAGAAIRRDRAAIRSDIDGFFERFPILGERRRQRAGTLSGGEQQMLAIARALMSRPRLLLLDEPSLGLSPLLVGEVFRIVEEIRARGTTVLLVEQNARMALRVADRGVILENGRFVKSGSAAELAADEDVREFYLGLRADESAKGYRRYKRKRRWR